MTSAWTSKKAPKGRKAAGDHVSTILVWIQCIKRRVLSTLPPTWSSLPPHTSRTLHRHLTKLTTRFSHLNPNFNLKSFWFCLINLSDLSFFVSKIFLTSSAYFACQGNFFFSIIFIAKLGILLCWLSVSASAIRLFICDSLFGCLESGESLKFDFFFFILHNCYQILLLMQNEVLMW